MKRVCFFGIYDPNYPRNRVLRAGFESNGYKVIDCRIDPKVNRGIFKYWKLYKEYKRLGLSNNPCDLVIVAFPGHTLVPLARLLFGRRFIFDAFVSLYDSNVADRHLYSSLNPRAWKDFVIDWVSVSLAPTVLLDTAEHIKYFHKTFNLNLKKAARVFVGTTIDRMKTKKKKESGSNFLVHFHGHYTPLHGIEYIIEAAKILEKDKRVRFRIIGGGQEYLKIEQLAGKLKLANIEFLPEVSFPVLVDLINESDLVLGIFGTTAKAGRVIPNKVFEGLALGKPIVTADTPAARELLTDGENVLFCQAGNSEDLAEKIALIKNDRFLSQKLGLGAELLNQSKLKPNQLVADLLDKLK